MKGAVRVVVAACLLLGTALVPVVAGTTTAHPLDGDDGNLTDTLDGTVSATTQVVNNTTDSVDDTTEETTDTLEDTTDGTTDTLESTSDGLDETTDSTTETVEGTTDTTTGTVDGTTDTLDNAVTSTDSTLERLLETQEELDGDGFPAAVTATPTPEATETATPSGPAGAGGPGAGDSGAGDGTGGDAERDARTLLAPSASVPLPDAGATATGMAGLGAVGAGLLAVQPGFGATVRGVGRSAASALERLVRAIAPLRYSRYDDSDPLEHDARAAVFDEISAEPGTYLSAVAERADVPLSTARHHLKVLEREGLVEAAKVRGRRRLFPAHADGKELAAALAEPATADVLATLARLGPSSASAVAAELDVTVSTVSHHLSRLEEDDLVDREREGQAVVNRLPPEVAAAFADEAEVEATEEPAVVGAD